MHLRLVETDDCSAKLASFRALARRLRDHQHPITPEVREALAGIVENLQKIYECRQVIDESLRHIVSAKETGNG